MASSDSIDTILSQRQSILSNSTELYSIKHELIDYMAAYGITMISKQYPSLYTHAPTTLLPTPINKLLFTKLTTLSKIWNKLIHCIANDHEFIIAALQYTVKVDEFTNKLVGIYQSTLHSKHKQSYSLGVHRSDYMFHMNESDYTLHAQQVEINTIASSFGALSTKVTKLHTYLYQRLYSNKYNWFLPKNDTVYNISHVLVHAHDVYCKQQAIDTKQIKTCILFVVQHGETNKTDQRDIEYTIFEHSGIPCIRHTFDEIYNNASVNDDNGKLQLDGYEIAVTYYRAGYTPRDYTTEHDWSALQLIESSITIKCPSTAYHLAGTKKIQQLCTRHDVLSKYLDDSEINLIQSVQAGMWGFDDINSLHDVLSDVRSDVHNYVLKPQREGGGNNIWGNEIIHILDTYSSDELQAYILMKKINSIPIRTALIRSSEITLSEVISELGIYSTYLSNTDRTDIVVDEFAGHLLRTKTVDSNEGGVAAGFAVIDSPVLV